MALCSHCCAIPTGCLQPSMNLSHAVAVVLAQLFELRLDAAAGRGQARSAVAVDGACRQWQPSCGQAVISVCSNYRADKRMCRQRRTCSLLSTNPAQLRASGDASMHAPLLPAASLTKLPQCAEHLAAGQVRPALRRAAAAEVNHLVQRFARLAAAAGLE